MNLRLVSILDKGNLDKERVVIKVMVDTDIGRYGLFRAKKNDTGITNKVFNTFWFPDKQAKAGDLIILYTKNGITSSNRNTEGFTSYFYFWGLTEQVWNYAVGAVLVSIPEWKTLS